MERNTHRKKHASPRPRQPSNRADGRSGALDLWIDLSATTFMDSSGLHLLLDTKRRAHELRRRLAIVCPPGTVRRVFDIAGVADALPLYEDLASAHRDS